MTIGVLSFHGDVAEHLALLHSLNVKALEVRSVEDLHLVDRLIIPGGESTVISRFLAETGVGDAIRQRVKEKALPVYGTCAGAILLARKATGKNAPKTLGLMDIVIDRNAYGSQMQSFQADVKITNLKKAIPVAFIRAPIITKIGRGVEVLAEFDGKPVLVKQGSLLAGTFHPETCGQSAIHEFFLSL